jgi:hypothetical protein
MAALLRLLVPLVVIAKTAKFAIREGELAQLDDFKELRTPDIQRAVMWNNDQPSGCENKPLEGRNPVVYYHAGHLRTFWNGPSVASSLQESFSQMPKNAFLNVIVTREQSMLPSDAASFTEEIANSCGEKKSEKAPKCANVTVELEPSIEIMHKMAGFYCEPFFGKVLSDNFIKESLAEKYRHFFEEGHSGSNTNSGKARGTMFKVIARLNNIYLREAHAEGLVRFKEVFGYEMPPDQIIVKDRPDTIYQMGILSNIPDMQALFRTDPNILFTQFHPVWTMNDMGFITTRAMIDEMLRVDIECMAQRMDSGRRRLRFSYVPEQAFTCAQFVLTKTMSSRVFSLDGMEPPKGMYWDGNGLRFCNSGEPETENGDCQAPPRPRYRDINDADTAVDNDRQQQQRDRLMKDELVLTGDAMSRRPNYGRWSHMRKQLVCEKKCRREEGGGSDGAPSGGSTQGAGPPQPEK